MNNNILLPNRGKKTKKWGRKVVVLFILMATIFTYYAGRILVFSEEPIQSDVIVVLSGDRGARIERAVELYKRGYSSKLIVSGGVLYQDIIMSDLMKNHAVKLGVPKKNVISEPNAESTYENAIYVKELMEQQQFRSAIVISSEYHMRRVKWVFDKIFRDSGITLTYCAAKDPEFSASYWWKNNDSMILVFNEYLKFAGYLMGKTK